MQHDLQPTTRTCTGARCREEILDCMLVRKDGQRVRHVFDPHPVAGGNHRIEPNLMGELEAHHDTTIDVGYVSHFATCIDAPSFRGASG